MKILQVSTAARTGGAGIAACRLHTGLRSLGVDSRMLVNKGDQPDTFIYGPDRTLDKVLARVCLLLDRVPGRLSHMPADRVSSSWVPNRLPARISAQRPDLVNLHWVNDGFMRIEALSRLRQRVVWTFHDMWAMAGGEHYVGDSLRYRQGYSAANRPAGASGLDVNRWIWNRKKKAWSGLKDLVVASPSRWLAECVRASALFRDIRVEVLPNGVDHERFVPMDHDVVRTVLGLPRDKKLILFGAVSATSDTRKGHHLLVETLKKLETTVRPDDYALVVFGASGGSESFAMQTHYLGTLHDEISMALVYAAADVFLAPSLEDNLPNTVLEALSCGTPVVAFNIGGMPDMVTHRANGYLAQGLHWVLEDLSRWESLSAAARETVLDTFTLQHAASRYYALYRELLGVA
jgi:glycosyltransferase involved in cell wall biosynthesis